MPPNDTPLFHPTKPLYWQLLNHQFKQVFALSHRKTIFALFVSTVCFIGLGIFLAFHPLGQIAVKNATDFSNRTQVLGDSTDPEPSSSLPSPTPIPTNAPPSPVYEISLSSKPALATLSSTLVADLLVKTLNLPLISGHSYPIESLRYDTVSQVVESATPGAKFNATYIAVIPNAPDLSLKSLYESDFARAVVKSLDYQLLPYVSDPKFCLKDTDCEMRISACIYNAFNQYEPFMDNLRCSKTATSSAIPKGYDSTLGCKSELVVKNPHCQANQCKAQEIIQCAENNN